VVAFYNFIILILNKMQPSLIKTLPSYLEQAVN